MSASGGAGIIHNAEEGEDGDPELEGRLRENAVTMNKMSDLRAQMEKLSVARQRQRKV